jgi:hypothetical protein
VTFTFIVAVFVEVKATPDVYVPFNTAPLQLFGDPFRVYAAGGAAVWYVIEKLQELPAPVTG